MAAHGWTKARTSQPLAQRARTRPKECLTSRTTAKHSDLGSADRNFFLTRLSVQPPSALESPIPRSCLAQGPVDDRESDSAEATTTVHDGQDDPRKPSATSRCRPPRQRGAHNDLPLQLAPSNHYIYSPQPHRGLTTPDPGKKSSPPARH